LQVLGCERGIHLEVVVEAVFDGGAEADVRIRAQASHRGSQYVRCGVPEHIQRAWVASGEHGEGPALAQRSDEIQNGVAEHDRYCIAEKSGSDACNHLARQGTCGHLAHVSIRKRESNRFCTATGQVGHPFSWPHESTVIWSLRSGERVLRRGERPEAAPPRLPVRGPPPAARDRRFAQRASHLLVERGCGAILAIRACRELAFFLRRVRLYSHTYAREGTSPHTTTPQGRHAATQRSQGRRFPQGFQT